MKFRILVERNEDGVFVATVPLLPGCVSQGAIEGYLESFREHDEPFPAD